MIQNLVSRITSRNIKCLYNREQNMYAINVIQNLVSGVTSRHIKCQYMRESNTHKIFISMWGNQIIKYSCNQCDSKFSQQSNLKTHEISVHERVKYSCYQCDSKFSQQRLPLMDESFCFDSSFGFLWFLVHSLTLLQ